MTPGTRISAAIGLGKELRLPKMDEEARKALFVNGEDMYFGNDRLPLVRAALLHGARK